MFHWRKEMERLNVPAVKVRRLYKSLSDVQIALPGLPSQQAAAYLCLFSANGGFGVSVVFHLHASRRLAFYLPDREKIPKQDAGGVLEEGIRFAESMGFMLGDLDFQLFGSSEQSALWDSLPLEGGIAEAVAPVMPTEKAGPMEEAGEIEELTEEAETIEEAGEMVEVSDRIGELEKDLGIRRAAVLRKRKPSPEELEARRKTLCENLGRFLASF